jgi:aminoglycoside phosphotransferase (APT) family kinase protein
MMTDGIAAYLRAKMPGAHEVAVVGLYRIAGGASRETWSFDASWQEGGEEQRRGFILRRDPDAGLLQTDRDVEYRVYNAFQQTAVPVPRMYWLETGSEALERPFFIMERIDGCHSDPARLALRADGPERRQIGRRKFEILGAIHAADPSALGRANLHPEGPPLPAQCAQRELARWERIVDEQQLEPEPVIRLAAAWLRAHPPAPAQRVTVCHGDFRSGNFLYTEDDIRGVLDWEMVHLGDPLEDLAWTCLKNWRYSNTPGVPGTLIGGIISREEAFAIYEAASGIRVDAEALRWWEIFSQIKAVGIWITGGRSFCDGRTASPLMALIPRLLNTTQYTEILDLLGW